MRVFLLTCIFVLLAGCGQKGPLILPPELPPGSAVTP
ncbi:MAG: lipoprotein [Pseudomonadales bacterium]|nr:lipoprotein [Pseudomonadales bacterium]